ncbi:uncharacterized protein LOC100680007 isoform X2 [Nasonia vitripennis]|uniref:Uncharacterized protein n=1 Tax=Nasonia vitripennis TaxID=7425 RepID=A0A7M7PYH1_NASVI|nr:uncharacterized protein LOC100680007 isoform X2 [Nasonia vitripennis]
MLKWTVSRSLSTASSTPHGPGGGRSSSTASVNNKANAGNSATERRPFRDLSNTPPAASSSSRRSSSRMVSNNNNNNNNVVVVDGGRTPKRTPSRRRRCRSHGSDLRGYFQSTKPNLRSGKRQSLSQRSNSPVIESFYQSTPRVDSDIGPLTLFSHQPHCHLSSSSSLTLPQNILNEARANNLQSHVTDFFQQISMATSPEDVMESESLPFASRRYALAKEQHRHTPCLPKLARVGKLNARNKTPYHTKLQMGIREMELDEVRQSPLAGKLLGLKLLDRDRPMYENTDNTVTEVLNREQESNFKSVAEILLKDSEERRKVEEEHVYETIAETPADEDKAPHNDSSVSSASQLLDNPSPISWAFCSPSSDLEGEFTLKRQRGIRRKRQANNKPGDGGVSGSKRAKREPLPFIEAVNRHVKRLALETDLDSSMLEDKCPDKDEEAKAKEEAMQTDEPVQLSVTDTLLSEERKEHLPESRGRPTTSNVWDTDSPKSSLLDSFATTTTTSALGTPETPLVATVRRCLKYSPETPGAATTSACFNRGSIEIECSAQTEEIHVKIIRCRDLRRAYEGPIHAYVKASLKDPLSGEGCVKRTAVHRATPNPVFQETLVLPYPQSQQPAQQSSFYNNNNNNNNCAAKQVSLDIAVWHRDRRARRSELLGCMTLPLPLSQDKEATWHPLEAGSGRNSSAAPASSAYSGVEGRGSVVISPPLSKDGAGSESLDNNNSTAGDDLTYLRHLELEPIDPLTGLPLHPGFTARGGRTPCTTTRRLVRPAANANQVPWGFSLSWGRPPRVERVDPGSPAERSGLRPGDYVVFVESTNVVTQPRDDILELIQTATNQLILEVYRRGAHGHAATGGGTASSSHRRSSVNVTLQAPVIGVAPSSHHHAIAFTAEAFPNLAADAPPEEELSVRETRYWTCLKSGQARFLAPLTERRDVLSAADHMILFQNLEELSKISEEIRDEGGGLESYLNRVPKITAAYRRYLSGLQRACCLLVALRKNSAFAKIVCEPAVPRRRKPDLTGVLLQPLEHYREMTRLLCQACPRNCQAVRDLAQGYREATANAAVMEPPRDTGRPLLSLQEVESRLVFARCKPFALAVPGRQWLFGGALAKVEGRGRLQPTWALLLTDLLVFARVSRDRVLFVTEEPLRLACIAEACFTVRKRPTEFRLQVTTQPSVPGENPVASTEVVQCAGTGGGGVAGGCSPHSRPRRRLLILRAPSPELKAVWHNLLQRQINLVYYRIYVNTGYGTASGADPGLESPDDDSPTGLGGGVISSYLTAHGQRELASSPEVYRSTQQLDEDKLQQSGDSLELMLMKNSSQHHQEDNHLAQWVRNSHQIPPPDHEVPIEEWTPEELAARTPRESSARDFSEVVMDMLTVTEESTVVNSDVEQQSTASSASLSTVKSNSLPNQPSSKKNGSLIKDASSGSINICRRCHRSGCPTPPPLARDPFSPLPPKIAVLPPTPDLCSKHARGLRNGLYDSPGRNSPSRAFSADGTTEDGSEDDLDCDGEPPYSKLTLTRRALRRFGTMSSLDQDDELDAELQTSTTAGEDDTTTTNSSLDIESPPPPPSGLRAWTLRASSYVVSKMLQPPAPPERTEFSLDPSSNGDEEGTTSGGTSGDDIWGTPTSGGPDDESFTGSPPPSNGASNFHHHPHHQMHSYQSIGSGGSSASLGEDNYGLNLHCDEDDEELDDEDPSRGEPESEGEDCSLPELSMEQLLGGSSTLSCSVGTGSLRSYLGRRRLEPLPEEEDSLSIGSGKHQQIGWW